MSLSSGDIVRFSIVTTDSVGRLFVNTLHYRLEGDANFITNEPSVSSCCQELWNYINSAYRQCQITVRTINRVDGRTEVATWNGEVASAGSYTVNLAGTLAPGDNKMPGPMCGVIDLRTDVASRSSRGWIMVPGPRDSAAMDTAGAYAAGGSYDGALGVLAALLDDKIQKQVTGVNAWHLTPVIYSRTRHKRAQTPFYFPVVATQAKRDPRWLRSRVSAP